MVYPTFFNLRTKEREQKLCRPYGTQFSNRTLPSAEALGYHLPSRFAGLDCGPTFRPAFAGLDLQLTY